MHYDSLSLGWLLGVLSVAVAWAMVVAAGAAMDWFARRFPGTDVDRLGGE